MAGRPSQDRKLHFNQNLTLRGGWRVGGSVLFETFGYDERLYATTWWRGPPPTAASRFDARSPARRGCPNLDYVLSFDRADAQGRRRPTGSLLWGKDENFFEWSSADIIFLTSAPTWRPTDQLRVEAAISCSRSSAAPTAATSASAASRASRSSTRCRGRSSCAWSPSRTATSRTRCATTRAPTCRSTSATAGGGITPALRIVDQARCGSTGCSRTSRRPARWSFAGYGSSLRGARHGARTRSRTAAV